MPLPVQAAAKIPAVPNGKDQPAAHDGKPHQTRILLIDDEEMVRKPLGEILKRAGYEVQTAADGKTGIELFRRQPCDLLITDLLMPEKDGLETIIALRQIQPELRIIVISGGNRVFGNELLRTAAHLGADQVLAKPFTRESILQAVATVLGLAKQAGG
jgi:YesN/AraC family two-component response regulator